nr:MAG TPA: hypothetical protein [Caudoviricetes sp.]
MRVGVWRGREGRGSVSGGADGRVTRGWTEGLAGRS